MKLVAAAIVLAGAMIAAALYFALAPRSATVAPAPAAVNQAPPVDVAAAALAALASYRPGLRMACWPADAGQRVASKWVVDLTFDGSGAQLARGFREERGAANPDVTACVERLLPNLRIAAPGTSTRVEVPFSLP